MAEEDPEMLEVEELGQIERRKMGLSRAHVILIAAVVLLTIGALVIVALRT
jgi:hypothetical protein